MEDGREVSAVLEDRQCFPLSLKFGRPRVTTNEKIVLASMFYPLYALAVQLSPEQGSSGIRELETETFRLCCSQTLTGIKFLVSTDNYMNLQLASTEEYIDGNCTGNLGEVLVR